MKIMVLNRNSYQSLIKWLKSYHLCHQQLCNGCKYSTVTVSHCANDIVKFIPRRAMLYVPGNDFRKLKKIRQLGVDCAVMDCEDGVALNQKVEAREMVKKMVDELDVGKTTEKAVRINSVDSGLAEQDLTTIFQAEAVPTCILVPKVDSVDHIYLLSEYLHKLRESRSSFTPPHLVLFMESARSLLDLDHICATGHKLAADSGIYNLAALVFGSDDYCASIGASRTESASELVYARQKFIAVAKAHNLQAIDMVHINYKDLDGLRHQCQLGSQMGFTGKQVIHPGQVPIVQQVFSPNEERIEWATGLIRAFMEQQQHGKGAFVYDDCMIDRPLLLQAQHIVAMADVITKLKNA